MLLPAFDDVFNLFLFEDVLENTVAGYLIHVKNFVSYDSLDTLGRQVVDHAPVRVFMQFLIPKSFLRVLSNV
jgi:hypothetical protein